MLKNKKCIDNNITIATYIDRKLCSQNFDASFNHNNGVFKIENEYGTLVFRDFDDYDVYGQYWFKEKFEEDKKRLVNVLNARNTLAFYN